jgi:hypothetical protein
MFVQRESAADPAPRQVAAYLEEMVTELAQFAAQHGRTELAASLSIVAIQASGERRRLGPEPA